jgi:hypothetical protein
VTAGTAFHPRPAASYSHVLAGANPGRHSLPNLQNPGVNQKINN